MATDNEIHNEDLDKLREANEEKKKKISEKFGATFSDMSTNNELPPEIESLFLDNIMAFENGFENAERIKLYDYLGNPPYRKLEELNENDIAEELKRITRIMDEHELCLNTICEVPERELYSFITEELFLEEIDDMRIPGMFTHFTYEEFHPNHAYDIRHHSEDFIHSYLNKADDFYSHLLSAEAEKADWHIHFREAFNSFQLNSFSIIGLNFDTEKANVQFACDFDGEIEGSEESLHFLGAGEMNLLYQWDYWCIDSVKLPKNLLK